MGLIACGDDDVVSPVTKNIITQLLPDPEGTVTARITNDGNYKNGLEIGNGLSVIVYMDKMNNLIVKLGAGSLGDSPSIVNVGQVAGLSAITKVPEEGFAERVATSERDGFIIRCFTEIGYSWDHGSTYGYRVFCRLFLASYIRDALGNIIGATIKYQTGDDWVEKNEK